jgi:hypothetical protein
MNVNEIKTMNDALKVMRDSKEQFDAKWVALAFFLEQLALAGNVDLDYNVVESNDNSSHEAKPGFLSKWIN